MRTETTATGRALTAGGSDQLAPPNPGVDHAVGEAPLLVVPTQPPPQRAVHDLGLVHGEYGRVRIVVEIAGDIGRLGVAEDAFELLLGGALHGAVDLVLRGRALGDEFEVDDRDIRCWHTDRDAVELA